MENNVGHRYGFKTSAIAIGMLMLLMAGGGLLAQQNQGPENNKELKLADLLKQRGKLLAEGKNASPAGQLKLVNYRVEELSLPRSMKVELQGQQVEVNKAWRVTVGGGPFPVRALPAVIWVDDQIVGHGIENELLSEITAITFDSSVIREGGVVSLSYGEDKEGRVPLSEKLNLSREGGIQ
jgi:hypothetical protein